MSEFSFDASKLLLISTNGTVEVVEYEMWRDCGNLKYFKCTLMSCKHTEKFKVLQEGDLRNSQAYDMKSNGRAQYLPITYSKEGKISNR